MQLVVSGEAHPRIDLELPEAIEHHVEELAARFEDADPPLPRQGVPEEEAQKALVAHLEREVLHVGQPLVQRLLPGRRQRVEGALHLPSRSILSPDEACLLQPPELRVDLTEARAPEEAGREVNRLLDVVTCPNAELQH